MNERIDVDTLLGHLDEAIRIGDDPAIQDIVKKIEAHYPEDPLVLQKMCNYCLFNLHDYEKGKDFAKRWVKADPDSLEAKVVLAGCHEQIMEFEESIDICLYILEHLDEETPGLRDRYQRLATRDIGFMAFCLREEGREVPELPAGLLEECEKPVEEWEYHEFYRKVLASSGKNEEALEQALKVLALRGGNAASYLDIGVLLAKAGRCDEAIWYLRKALRSRGRKAVRDEGLVWLAYCYFKTGRRGRRALSPLLTWRSGLYGEGNLDEKIMGGCLLRTYALTRKTGEKLLKLLLSKQPHHSTLRMLRALEEDLGLRRMALEELGVSRYLEELPPGE